jgi:hypothetical protein
MRVQNTLYTLKKCCKIHFKKVLQKKNFWGAKKGTFGVQNKNKNNNSKCFFLLTK